MDIFTCTRTYDSVIAITINTYYILPLAVYGLIEDLAGLRIAHGQPVLFADREGTSSLGVVVRIKSYL